MYSLLNPILSLKEYINELKKRNEIAVYHSFNLKMDLPNKTFHLRCRGWCVRVSHA